MVTTCRGVVSRRAHNKELKMMISPAPPPNLWAQVMSMMFESTQEDTELLRKIAQLLNRNGGCHDDQPRQSTYQNFLSTHPPTFEHAREPLDADNFIRIIESIFGLLQWTNAQKPLFAAQQLLGSAVVWWAYYMASLPEGHIVLWEEFKYAFRSHFIPAGIMERKLQEFLDLKQGGRTVLEYSQKFNHLAQYAFLSVDLEAKKRAAFRRGMNPALKEKLTWQTMRTFNDLVNAAIVQEDAYRKVQNDNRKRKAPTTGNTAAPPPKHRLVYTSPTG
ncbi:hypothetical protein PR202_gb29173 [Eleusine coracana subsp. coracana]|uniref:Retrotransposon gag domain-containing protein n=1 Tax=Eleusine coracana subsp. coracana TaxID=191504 RepID=A0AAV5FZ63_ELECO|nr:hypothetical protein PR202_gb29173 [Eleusine coracana subsp. coracana]